MEQCKTEERRVDLEPPNRPTEVCGALLDMSALNVSQTQTVSDTYESEDDDDESAPFLSYDEPTAEVELAAAPDVRQPAAGQIDETDLLLSR